MKKDVSRQESDLCPEVSEEAEAVATEFEHEAALQNATLLQIEAVCDY